MADYYFSAAGNDTTGDGSIGTPYRGGWDKVMTLYEAATGGDQFLFNKGDTFHSEADTGPWFNEGDYRGNEIIFDAYGTGATPILTTSGANKILFNLNSRQGNTDTTANAGGVIVRNLKLLADARGTGRGFHSISGNSWWTLDNIIVEGFSTGASFQYGGMDQTYGIKVLNSTFQHNSENGFFGGSDGLVIDNTTFDNNGYDGPVFDHNLYLSGAYNPVTGLGASMRVTNSTFLRSAQTYGDVIDLGTDDFTGTPLGGHYVTGDTSGATGTISEITATEMVIDLKDVLERGNELSERFIVGETITVTELAETSSGTIGVVNPWDRSASSNVVVHGFIDTFVFRDNYLFQEYNAVTGAFATAQGSGLGVGAANGSVNAYGFTEHYNRIIVQGNQFYNMGSYGIIFDNTKAAEISNNYIEASTRFSVGIKANQDDALQVQNDNVNIVSNTILLRPDPRGSYAKHGIDTDSIANLLISKNRVLVTDENVSTIGITADLEAVLSSTTGVTNDNTTYEFTAPLAAATNSLNN